MVVAAVVFVVVLVVIVDDVAAVVSKKAMLCYRSITGKYNLNKTWTGKNSELVFCTPRFIAFERGK